ncbi:hypothetical protein BX600DRAFT_473568 [Xylariales sp. PMI_506]|nr:hypothetical protein BX600DRAFT_473568 [Xylariales sp. PMI_506]
MGLEVVVRQASQSTSAIVWLRMGSSRIPKCGMNLASSTMKAGWMVRVWCRTTLPSTGSRLCEY